MDSHTPKSEDEINALAEEFVLRLNGFTVGEAFQTFRAAKELIRENTFINLGDIDLQEALQEGIDQAD